MAVTAAAPTAIAATTAAARRAQPKAKKVTNLKVGLIGYSESADATTAMDKAGVPDWVEEQQKRKLRWCGHVARRFDGRGTTRILN